MADEQSQTTPETWHKKMMEVSWTDSGKVLIRHPLKGAGRISYPVEIQPHIIEQMTRHKDD